LNTQVYGANLVRIDGNYDQVNRLSTQIAERYNWGFVNVNLRPYYAEGSKTVGYEIAEQLGWRLPDNVVVPMAGGALISKIYKAFGELVELGLVEDKPVRFFGAQATGCSPIAHAVKNGLAHHEPQRPNTIARSLAIGNPADGPYAIRAIRESGGWAEDVSDVEIVSAIQELAETEGVFTETAGGVTTAVTARLYAHGRIAPGDLTVVAITGNGLKTLDVLQGKYEQKQAIRPRMADFEAMVEQDLEEKNAGRKCMSVKVVLPNAFQKHTNGTREIQSSAANLPQLITEIETSFPALKPHLRDNDGKVRRFINFYVNEEDIRFLGNDEYAFKDGDEVLVIPSIAGGSF
jgi:threonine synthase